MVLPIRPSLALTEHNELAGPPIGERDPSNRIELVIIGIWWRRINVGEYPSFAYVSTEFRNLCLESTGCSRSEHKGLCSSVAEVAAENDRRKLFKQSCSINAVLHLVFRHIQPGAQKQVSIDVGPR